ncbi:MAG TPA: LCP family protein [Actinopolymorphaceae bacterium]
MTLIAPGLAQYVAGSRRVGAIALRTYAVLGGLALLAAGVVLLSRAGGAALGFAVALGTHGAVLTGVRIALCVVAIAWFALFVDALRLGEPRALPHGERFWASLVAVGLSLAVVAVLLTGAHYVDVTQRSLDQVFHARTVSAPEGGRYNILLLGGDAGPGRIGMRPDSITLVSIDQETGRAAMLGFPRNLQRVPFTPGSPMDRAWPNGFDCGTECLLNAVNTWANQHREIFPPSTPDPGIAATRDAITALTGLKVNYHVVMNMGGFAALVDAVGGIRITLREPMPMGPLDAPYSQVLPAGEHHFDGAQALAYARTRSADSDYSRMARQRCVMAAMLRQLDPGTVLRRFEAIAEAGTGSIRTDIPAAELGSLVEIARKVREQPIVSVQFVPPLINTTRPDLGAIRRTVQQAVRATQRPPASDQASATKGGRASTPRSETTPAPETTPASTSESEQRDTGVAELGRICAAD